MLRGQPHAGARARTQSQQLLWGEPGQLGARMEQSEALLATANLNLLLASTRDYVHPLE